MRDSVKFLNVLAVCCSVDMPIIPEDADVRLREIAVELSQAQHEVDRLRDVILSGQIQRRLLNDMANAGCNCGSNYGCILAQRRLSDMEAAEKPV